MAHQRKAMIALVVERCEILASMTRFPNSIQENSVQAVADPPLRLSASGTLIWKNPSMIVPPCCRYSSLVSPILLLVY